MKSVWLNLNGMERVKKLVSITEKYPFDMDLHSGRYVVDAKSMLGIFSLDLSLPVCMDIYSENTEKLFDELAPFLTDAPKI